eukprot:scaffold27888_cov21-Tisochrysis_lutea.AAC.1
MQAVCHTFSVVFHGNGLVLQGSAHVLGQALKEVAIPSDISVQKRGSRIFGIKRAAVSSHARTRDQSWGTFAPDIRHASTNMSCHGAALLNTSANNNAQQNSTCKRKQQA